MRIPSGKTDVLIYFVAVDATDLKTRETGLSGFTVYRSRNGGAATAYTTPTVAELSAANMPGVYALTVDEDTTIAAGSDSEEYVVHITQAAMAPVTRTIELYRRDTTSGQTLTVTSGGVTLADGVSHGGTLGSSTATLALSRLNVTSQTAAASAVTFQGNTSGHGLISTGGTTGTGATFTGGATSGAGLVANAPTNGDGATFSGTGSSRHGINATAGSAGSGINAAGAGSGSGLAATGGATGAGATLLGGATSGAGLIATGPTNGDGAAFTGTGASRRGATFTAGTNADGIRFIGAGTGNGLYSVGGATGHGSRFVGGATSGSGITALAQTDGNGMELIGIGTGFDLNADMTGNITGNLSGSVGSVTGAVGSVTGNVGGNVTGSVGSVAAGGITAASIATDAIDADAIAASAVTEIQSGLSTLNAAAVSAAVWDAATASYGAAGSYGLLVETNLDAAVSSRLSTAGYTAPDNASIAAILVDTGTTLDGKIDSILADTGTDGVVISAATQGAIADKLLGRSLATGADGGRTVQDALRANRNKQAISAGTLTVYQEDDTTPAWTAAVATTPGDPLSSMDPA